MATIRPDELAAEVQKILDDYGDIARNALGASIEETAKESAKQLRQKKQGRTKWKNYPKSWSAKVQKSRLDVEGLVYNKEHYRLAHLLEFGHATRNGGRTEAFPHIAEVDAFAQEDVLKRLKEKLEL